MSYQEILLRLPQKVAADARIYAQAQDVTLDDLIRQLLFRVLAADAITAKSSPKTGNDQLADVLTRAGSWNDLERQLRLLGYYLKSAGAGMAIYKCGNDRFVCNTATVGYRYRSLAKRFGGPMPGHPHLPRGMKVAKEDTFEVIERF